MARLSQLVTAFILHQLVTVHLLHHTRFLCFFKYCKDTVVALSFPVITCHPIELEFEPYKEAESHLASI